MRKLFIALSLFICCQAIAQDYVAPLSYNPRLYYSTAKYLNQPSNEKHKNFVIVGDSGTTLIESDTLSLPFIDDFTHPTLKPYDFSSYIYDTIYNAIGPCDSQWNVATVTDSLSFGPTYTYTFDTATMSVDSTPNAPIIFLNTIGFSGDCFYQGDTAMLWPRGYINVYDSSTGAITFQIFDTTETIVAITYAPVLYKAHSPTYTKWLDNYAYQNNTCGYLPPSIGVATLDGLNQYGQPYSQVQQSYGIADILTSKPINLGAVTYADSVYLSFYYQPGGFGYSPVIGDSLVLQFYNGYTNNWDDIWSTTGDSIPAIPPDTPDAFRQVIIQLDSTTNSPPIQYFYNGFQFRFLNYGYLTGFGDIWNIDYVRLDQNRTFVDTAISDIAFQYQFPSILQNYTEMPIEQFIDTGALIRALHAADTSRQNTVLADTLALYVANLNPVQAATNPPNSPYTTTAEQTFPVSSVVLAPLSNQFNAGLENVTYLYPNSEYSAPAIGQDTMLVIHSQAVLNNPDILTANDTISHDQVLYNILAYDDGTAELAYGLQSGQDQVKKFAYDYTLNTPDTIVGYQVMYASVNGGAQDVVFDFNVWDTLVMNNVYYTDSPVFTSYNETPSLASYIDSVNGYSTYLIPPVPVPTHFYFGWAQTDVTNIEIGYDMNSTKGRPHMFIYSSGVWDSSTIASNGSPMIRLILGHTYQTGTGVKSISINPIKVYPNPTTGILSFDLPESGDTYSIQLYSLLGQLSLSQSLSSSNSTLDISNLTEGVYLLRVTDDKTGITYQNKIVKSPKE